MSDAARTAVLQEYCRELKLPTTLSLNFQSGWAKVDTKRAGLNNSSDYNGLIGSCNNSKTRA